MEPPSKKICRRIESTHYQAITAHEVYRGKSFEELRLEDYAHPGGHKFGDPSRQPDSFGKNAGLAASKVFGIFELCEKILLQVSYAATNRHRAKVEAQEENKREEIDVENFQFYPSMGINPSWIKWKHVPADEMWEYHDHWDPNQGIVDRRLEPLITLAPLHRVSTSFSGTLKHSPSLQREMFHRYSSNSPKPRDIIWWLLVRHVGGLRWCTHGYLPEEFDDHHVRDGEVSFSVGWGCLQCEEYQDTCECMGRDSWRHEPQYYKELGSEHEALAKFLANGKRSSPDASWRQVSLARTVPDAVPLSVTLIVTHLDPKSLHCDSEPFLDPDIHYTRTCTCDHGDTLGTFFDWWVGVMQEAAGHEAAAWHDKCDCGRFGNVPCVSSAGRASHAESNVENEESANEISIPKDDDHESGRLETSAQNMGAITVHGAGSTAAQDQEASTATATVKVWVTNTLTAVFRAWC